MQPNDDVGFIPVAVVGGSMVNVKALTFMTTEERDEYLRVGRIKLINKIAELRKSGHEFSELEMRIIEEIEGDDATDDTDGK